MPISLQQVTCSASQTRVVKLSLALEGHSQLKRLERSQTCLEATSLSRRKMEGRNHCSEHPRQVVRCSVPRLTVRSQKRRVRSEASEIQDRCLAQKLATLAVRRSPVLLRSLALATCLGRKTLSRQNLALQHNLRPVRLPLLKVKTRVSSLRKELQPLAVTRRMDSGSQRRRREQPQDKWQRRVGRPKHPQCQVKERRRVSSLLHREIRRMCSHLPLRSLIHSSWVRMLVSLGSQARQGNLDSQSLKRRKES